MDFFNFPEPPSPEYVHDKHMHTQEDLLNQVIDIQHEQLHLINKINDDSQRESRVQTKRFIIQTALSIAALIASVVAAVAAIIALL